MVWKRVMVGLLCLSPLVCASCLTLTLPKSARVESSPSAGAKSDRAIKDARLVDTWELLYQVNDKGDEQRPRDSTRTIIEFTDRGNVIFNRIDRENSDHMKSRSGKYSLENNEISITDDVGNTVKWPYSITGDTLVIVMPEVKKKFYWRRYR
ncbi:MAG: lipocalin family protein, partial [Deltaproteobacteria bacterium]